jgi:BirA family biotin operon repressor/biotin-[acetyl-CoA-carboxylase] ligase
LPEPLPHHFIELPFIELRSVDSTNNYARRLLDGTEPNPLPPRQENEIAGVSHGTAIFAYEQVAGKGQRGKTWLSEKDSNIQLSIVINTASLLINQQFQLSACVAVSAQQFLENILGGGVTIKWPNDLYWHDRKAGGILIESIITLLESGIAKWQWAIAGVGININQTHFSAGLLNPVSLKQITGSAFDTVLLAKELHYIMLENFEQLVSKGFDAIYSRYNEVLYKKNETVRLKKEGRLFEAVIKKVTPMGQLIVQHGIEETLDFGQVEWLMR